MIERLFYIGLIVVLIGIMLIFLGTLLTALKAYEEGKTKVEGGGVIFIGPIPIVFGTNREITWYMILGGIALLILLIVLTLILNKKII